MGDDAPPPNESASGSRDIMILDKRARVFPIAEAESKETNTNIEKLISARTKYLPVVVWSTTKVKDYSEDNEANNGQDFDRAGHVIKLRI